MLQNNPEHRPRLLILDEDRIILQSLSQFLAREGYEVRTTADPEEAIGSWAWLACVTGGNRGAILLGAAALILATAPAAARRAGVVAQVWMGRAAWSLAAAGGALALESLLRAQVVYALSAALALAVLIGIPGRATEPAR
jgi:hypothetical protein